MVEQELHLPANSFGGGGGGGAGAVGGNGSATAQIGGKEEQV
jgi:hypothetical protein